MCGPDLPGRSRRPAGRIRVGADHHPVARVGAGLRCRPYRPWGRTPVGDGAKRAATLRAGGAGVARDVRDARRAPRPGDDAVAPAVRALGDRAVSSRYGGAITKRAPPKGAATHVGPDLIPSDEDASEAHAD